MNIASFFQAIAGFSWLLVFILLAIILSRSARRQPTRGLTTGAIAVLIFAVLTTMLGMGLVFIEPYEMGVVVSVLAPGGMRSEPLSPGLHWIVPFVERVERYSTAIETFTMSRPGVAGENIGDFTVEARTSDGQRIFVDSSVIYRLDPAAVIEIHRKWQRRYRDDLILPVARGIIRDAVSQYRVDEVISTRRFDMTARISNELNRILAENGLILVDFVLRDITFTEEYAQSIEQKQIAEQQALQAKFVVEQKRQEAEQARQIAQGQADAAVIKARGEAQARLIQAEAEAKANELLAASLAGRPELLTYLYISRLASNIQVMLLPSDSPFLLPLPGFSTPTPTPVPAP